MVEPWFAELARGKHEAAWDCFLDRYRKLSTRDRIETEMESQPVESPRNPHEVVANDQLRVRLDDALRSLDPKQRQVLEIAYFEGLSHSEIAQRIDSPLGTVKYWTRQGLMRLKEIMPRDGWV